MDVARELQDLQRLVRELQTSVTVLTETSARFQSEMAATADGTRKRLDTLNTQVWALRDDMPVLLSEAMQHRRTD
jgi:uncharacterized protein YlxW (UPF0749 family)